MPESDIAKSREVLSFATELQLFAREHAPDSWTERVVNKAVSRIREVYGTTHGLKCDLIVAWLKNPVSGESASKREIAEHFHWKRDDVDRCWDVLLAESPRRVEVMRHQGVGAGRPALRIRLILPPRRP